MDKQPYLIWRIWKVLRYPAVFLGTLLGVSAVALAFGGIVWLLSAFDKWWTPLSMEARCLTMALVAIPIITLLIFSAYVLDDKDKEKIKHKEENQS